MIKLFADGADLASIQNLKNSKDPLISGFTTNPTLMRKAGIHNYEAFAKEMLQIVEGLPVSFEVFADGADEMYRQAKIIASWGSNVYVKIPVTNTNGIFLSDLIGNLIMDGVKVNVTALCNLGYFQPLLDLMAWGPSAYISIFAGRIADTGRDPLTYMHRAYDMIKGWPEYKRVEIIWASPREVLNVYQADAIGINIITCTPDILKKLALRGKDLDEYSLDTVQMFSDDAKASGFTL